MRLVDIGEVEKAIREYFKKQIDKDAPDKWSILEYNADLQDIMAHKVPTAFNTDRLIDRLNEESDASCENFDKYAEEHAICKNENTFSDGLIRAVEIIRECESDGNG